MKATHYLFFLVTLLFIYQGAAKAQTTLQVSKDGSSPYSTLQAAYNDANHGDIIKVHVGTYFENLTIQKSITISSTDGPDKTFIKPKQPGKPIVAFIGGSGGSILKGFTVTEGSGTRGAAINIYENDSYVRITNCIISNNKGEGAVQLRYGAGIFENCVFKGNDSHLYCDAYPEGIFVNSNFHGNSIGDSPTSREQPLLFLNCNFDFIPQGNIQVHYSNVVGGFVGNDGSELGEGNINTDPLIADDNTLSNFSKLIGKGTAQYHFVNEPGLGRFFITDKLTISAPKFDIYDNPRPSPNGTGPDIGAYENGLGEAQQSTNNSKPVARDAKFYLLENPMAGNGIGKVEALDSNDDPLSYSIIKGNEYSAFDINTQGIILARATEVLNKAVKEHYSLLVKVSDGISSDTANVDISLISLGDTVTVEVFDTIQIAIVNGIEYKSVLEEFVVYPNPVTDGQVWINASGFTVEKVYVYNATGIKIRELAMPSNTIILEESPGVYFLMFDLVGINNMRHYILRRLIVN